MKRSGAFTISLDFELHWGSRDHRPLEGYRDQLLGGRAAVPRLLKVFSRHGIRATWATVGLMFFESREELLAGLPTRRPQYLNSALSPYSELASIGLDESQDPFHYGASLIREITQTPGQELATHTFSHYYCLEAGQTAEDFRADLRAARELSIRKQGIEPKSIVFPRNQFNSEYVELCAEEGLSFYRGNPRSRIYAPRSRPEDRLVYRAIRLLDSYVNLTGHHGYGGHGAKPPGPIDVPASRFLRPYSKRLARFEKLRLKRICDDLTYCSEHGLLYHLWWHPDNFGAQAEENFRFLTAVLSHFEGLRSQGRMQSLSMSEAGQWMLDYG